MITIKIRGWHYLDDNGDRRFVAAAHSAACPEGKDGRTVTVDDLNEVEGHLTSFVAHYARESRSYHDTCYCLGRFS